MEKDIKEEPKETTKVFKTSVTYTSRIVTDEDGDRFPVHRKIRVVTSHIKIYDGVFQKIATLGKCAVTLIGFIGQEMDAEGMIRNDAHTKRKFKEYVREITDHKINYSEASMNIAFSELVKNDFLITKGKGLFKLNPQLIYRNSDLNRLEAVRKELEEQDNKAYNALQNKVTTDN